MNTTIRNVLGVVAGFVAGSAVNIGLVLLSGLVVAPPPGADLTTAEGIKAAMGQLGPQHFVMPFLAHALGTLVGAWVAALIAASHKYLIAMLIGVVTLAGGAYASYIIPAPLWFKAVDLIFAYIPMAYLGGKLANR